MENREVVINPPLMDAKQACFYLGGISRRTLTNLVLRGELQTVAVFRRRMYRKHDLDRLARVGTKEGSGQDAR